MNVNKNRGSISYKMNVSAWMTLKTVVVVVMLLVATKWHCVGNTHLSLSLSLSRSTKLFFSGLSLLFRRVRVSEVLLLQRRGGSPGLEIYNEHESTEKYLIQSTKSSPHSTPKAPEEIEGMDNEVAPEFIVDQGLCYSTGNNFYGYYCTGFESPNEWDDHRTFFGVDGPDLNYTGLQTESLPYVYYTPSYGYAQSPYNPYNPYIPGATVGTDSSFVGTQQYYTGPNFQPNVSSSPYFPLVVQSRPDIVPNISPDSSLLSTGASKTNKPNGPGSKQTLSSASARTTPAPPRPALGDVKVEPAVTSLNQAHSSAKISEGSKANVAPSKQPVAHGVVTSGSSPHLASSHVTQGRFASGSIQAADYSSLGRVSSPRSSLKVALPVSNGLSDFGTRGWSTVEKLRPRMHYGGVLNYVNGSPEVLGEQNRGPRTNRSKSQWAPSFSVKAYTTKAGASNAQGDITIYANQYNKDDFPVNFADAKFFVIKSYSEDDVHKSIKYNVWSSTPNGNKRLDGAYEDAQRIAAGKPRGCPIFLFFSVNASGQFCGVAEMIGPVDFCKDMDFWQQDKWSGSFPVKWHIIKDVPNTNFRHIILENNENKPVTNSRDTQEIRYKQGMEMLNIFKNYTSKTSMLDDFMFYEDRQKIMHEEKVRLSKSYDGSYFIPTLVPPKPIGGVDLPLKAKEKPSIDDDLNSLGKTVASTSEQAPSKSDANSSSSNTNVSANHNLVEDVNDITPVLKIGSLTINPKQAEFEPSEVTAEQDDVVTIGSMPVKVNGFGCSSGILTVGTIPLDPKKLELDRAGVFSAAGNPF